MNVNHLFKSVTFWSILLIIYGIVCNYIYYNQFGIVITDYIDIGEVIFLFVPFLVNVIWLLVIFILYYVFFKSSFLDENKPSYHLPMNIEFRKTQSEGSIIMFSVLLLFLPFFFIFKLNHSFLIPVVLITWIYGPFFIDRVCNLLEKHFKTIKIDSLSRDFFVFLLAFTSMVLFSTYQKTSRVTKKKYLKPFIIQYNSGFKLVNDSTYYILGRTKSYVFLYRLKSKRSHVINVSDIKEFVTQ